MTTTIEGRYVPPHLRHRRPPPSSSPIAGPSRTSVAAQNTTAAPRHSRLAPNRSESRTPWAASAPSPSPSRISTSRDTSPRRALAASSTPAGRIHSVAPTLHVYGDSFVGPLKLLTEDCVRINSFKGASAKVSICGTGSECPSVDCLFTGSKQSQLAQAGLA